MTRIFIKKANKTPTSNEEEIRRSVQEILDQIEKNRDEAVRNISKKFDKYEGDVIISKERIEEVIENLGEPLYIDAQSDQDEEIITKHLYYNFRTKQYKTESPPGTVAISESDIFWGRRTILQFTFIEDHLIGWEEDKLIFNMADTDKKSGSLLKYFGLLLNIILTAKVFSM